MSTYLFTPLDVRIHSSTHFWETYDPYNPTGAYTLSGWCVLPYSCSVPGTAWNRLENYIFGGWEIKKQYPGVPSEVYFHRWDGQGKYRVVSYGPIGMKYEGLIEGSKNLYHTGYMKITGRYVNALPEWEAFDPPLEIRLTGSEKYFCYEILGRMSHCLTDLSVPAHTHKDPHPWLPPYPDGLCDGDAYETRMDGQYQNYTASNTGGSFINPFLQNQFHPVYYLAFASTQIAGHFPSNDKERYNTIYTQLPFEIVGTILTGAPIFDSDIFSGHGPNSVSQENFEIIANYCMKSTIRLNAGLFYWFAKRSQECQDDNLNLENITVNGDETRNYCAKYVLTASGPSSPSFFNIEPNATVRFNSGNTIILKPGFHAKTGSLFTASITPTVQNENINSLAMLQNNSKVKNEQINKENALSNIPKEFSLSQNYPNPFNPTTLIEYGLKQNVDVKITVYDILGKVVSILVNEYQDAGYRSVTWDGTNNYGTGVATGLYIYKIEAGSFVSTKKMLLLK